MARLTGRIRRFGPKRPEEIAGAAFLRDARKWQLDNLRLQLIGTGLQNRPEAWDEKLRVGARFSVVPKDSEIEALRQRLGINRDDTVVVAPVFSGEWSKIHPKAIGIDFSEKAIQRHPNGRKILADLRDIPLETGSADHIISYEPSPLNAGVAEPQDILTTLAELIRVGDRVHIIQRARGTAPRWLEPFVMKYIGNLGIPYTITDISEHVESKTRFFRLGGKNRVIAVTLDGKTGRALLDTIIRDGEVAGRAMRITNRSRAPENIRRGLEIILMGGSPALKKAFYATYIGWQTKHHTTKLRNRRQQKI